MNGSLFFKQKYTVLRCQKGPASYPVVWLCKSSLGADSIWPQLWFQANGPKLLPFAALAMPPRARTWKKLWVKRHRLRPCDGYWWILMDPHLWFRRLIQWTPARHRMTQALWVWLPLRLKSWLICPNLHCNLQTDSNFQAKMVQRSVQKMGVKCCKTTFRHIPTCVFVLYLKALFCLRSPFGHFFGDGQIILLCISASPFHEQSIAQEGQGLPSVRDSLWLHMVSKTVFFNRVALQTQPGLVWTHQAGCKRFPCTLWSIQASVENHWVLWVDFTRCSKYVFRVVKIDSQRQRRQRRYENKVHKGSSGTATRIPAVVAVDWTSFIYSLHRPQLIGPTPDWTCESLPPSTTEVLASFHRCYPNIGDI